MSRRVKRPAGKSGSAIVEFLLSAIVLLSFMFGIIDFARLFYTYEFVAYTARQGARYASVRGSACSSWTSACPATAADILAYVQGLAIGIDPANLTMNTTAGSVWPATSPSAAGCSAGVNNPGCEVRVSLSYNYQQILPFLLGGTIPLQSSSEMLISQ